MAFGSSGGRWIATALLAVFLAMSGPAPSIHRRDFDHACAAYSKSHTEENYRTLREEQSRNDRIRVAILGVEALAIFGMLNVVWMAGGRLFRRKQEPQPKEIHN